MPNFVKWQRSDRQHCKPEKITIRTHVKITDQSKTVRMQRTDVNVSKLSANSIPTTTCVLHDNRFIKINMNALISCLCFGDRINTIQLEL